MSGRGAKDPRKTLTPAQIMRQKIKEKVLDRARMISVNKEKVPEDFVITKSDLIAEKYVLLQRGKKSYFLLRFY